MIMTYINIVRLIFNWKLGQYRLYYKLVYSEGCCSGIQCEGMIEASVRIISNANQGNHTENEWYYNGGQHISPRYKIFLAKGHQYESNASMHEYNVRN